MIVENEKIGHLNLVRWWWTKIYGTDGAVLKTSDIESNKFFVS